jgi:hypothetical protein
MTGNVGLLFICQEAKLPLEITMANTCKLFLIGEQAVRLGRRMIGNPLLSFLTEEAMLYVLTTGPIFGLLLNLGLISILRLRENGKLFISIEREEKNTTVK